MDEYTEPSETSEDNVYDLPADEPADAVSDDELAAVEANTERDPEVEGLEGTEE